MSSFWRFRVCVCRVRNSHPNFSHHIKCYVHEYSSLNVTSNEVLFIWLHSMIRGIQHIGWGSLLLEKDNCRHSHHIFMKSTFYSWRPNINVNLVTLSNPCKGVRETRTLHLHIGDLNQNICYFRHFKGYISQRKHENTKP